MGKVHLVIFTSGFCQMIKILNSYLQCYVEVFAPFLMSHAISKYLLHGIVSDHETRCDIFKGNLSKQIAVFFLLLFHLELNLSNNCITMLKLITTCQSIKCV